jgi:glucose/arabinose dehydrogenase
MRARSPQARAAGVVALAAATALGCSNYYLPLGDMTVNFPGFTGDAMAESEVRRRLRVPDGFSVATYGSGIENARMLAFTSTGDLLVSSPRDGAVYLLERDRDGDGTADGRRVVLGELNRPHGVALHDGWLYVGETDAVLRVRFDAASGAVQGAPERIVTGLPGGGNHWTRTVHVGPDDRLYVSVGSSCNVCLEDDRRRATILRYALDGTGETIWASGLRNAVDFAWQPGTGRMYATDNGRDFLGDDFPPCELDRVVEGGFYGWPYANGDRVPDPDYGAKRPDLVASSIPPVHGFVAHTAPLGMAFYDGTAFPERWRGAALVALHGSWNRSTKSGYEVVAVFLGEDGTAREEPFLTGFLIDEKVYGRPVDVAVGPDGAAYVSDDFTGSVYRVAYGAAVPLPGAAGGASTAAGSTAGDPLAKLSPEERSAAVARVRALWEANKCVACHGAGQSGPNHRALGALAGKYTIDALARYFVAPQPPMPAYPLTEEQRRDLAVYVLATYP